MMRIVFAFKRVGKIIGLLSSYIISMFNGLKKMVASIVDRLCCHTIPLKSSFSNE